MKVIGITGGVGAGKTEILEYLNSKYGATICHTDNVAKKLQKKGGLCYGAIVEHFGEDILDEKGELNRELLASVVFSNAKELAVLNEIVHPAVKDEVRRKIAKEERRHTNVFVVESAILVEDAYDEICDELWYIYARDSVRRNRLIFNRGYSEKKVEEIIAAQPPKEVYMKNCDRVIDNSGVFEETMEQLDAVMKSL